MNSTPDRVLTVPVLLGVGIAVGVIVLGVIALMGVPLPGETSAKHQQAVEVYSPPRKIPRQAKTQPVQPAAVSEPAAADTPKSKKDRQANPQTAVETVAAPERPVAKGEIVAAIDESSAGSGASTGASDAYASGSGLGGGASSSGGGYGSSSAGGGFQVSGGSGFGFGGGLNQSPRGSPAVPAPVTGAPANAPQAGPAPVLTLAGPTPAAPASSPNLPGSAPTSAPLPPQAGPSLPAPAPLAPQAAPPPAVPIPTPDQILTAAVDPKAGDGVLRPGHSPGTAYENDLTKYNAIEIEIAGSEDGQYDVVHVTGPVASFPEGFKISFILLDAYVPASGADFEFLFANALEGEENISYFFDPKTSVLPIGFGYQVYVDSGADLHVRFYDATSPPPQGYVHDLYTGQVDVPEPSTAALALLGLALLGSGGMRRRVATPKH